MVSEVEAFNQGARAGGQKHGKYWVVTVGNGLVAECQISGKHSDDLGEAVKRRVSQALIYNCPNYAMPKSAWPEAQMEKLFPASLTQSRHFKKEYAQRDLLSLIHTKQCMC